MACTDGSCITSTEFVCGTGGWTGPKPGDPENIPSIRARGIVGAIEVSWFYPTINSHSVGHFRVYRGINAEFALAVERGIISANIFVDQIPENETREYFYWVRMVTVNGTVMDPVGPASATPHKLSEDLLEHLTAEIDESKLAQSLRERIGLIDGIRRDIAQETLDRINANSTFANALVHVQTAADQVATYVQNEVIQRQDADSALVESVSALAAGLSENEALIVAEQIARTTADEAFASDISILYTNVDENKAAILQEQQARSDEKSAVASQLNALVTQMGDSSAAIEAEKQARVSADNALIADVTNWAAKTNIAAAGLANEITARTNADTSLAQQIQTAQTQLGSNLASVQTTMQTQINATNGKVNNIGALWTAKVDVNGLVGGFGVYNSGQFVEAGFDVDRFWVGRTTDKVKPFIVDSGVVYIDKARIRNADIDTLKIAGKAITVPAFVEAWPSINIPANTLPATQIIGYTDTFADAADVLVTVCVVASNTGSATNCTIALYVDGVFNAQRNVSIQTGWTTSVMVTFGVRVSKGSHMFSIRVGNNWGSGGPWVSPYASASFTGYQR